MNKTGASILVVDDEREIVRALQRSLVAHGYHVVTANNGQDALTIIFQQHPDLVVLDLLMPGMSGLEVCRQVRATSSVPIIVLSVRLPSGSPAMSMQFAFSHLVRCEPSASQRSSMRIIFRLIFQSPRAVRTLCKLSRLRALKISRSTFSHLVRCEPSASRDPII